MSDNVGLSTPRGSGTSGFVQRNRAYMQPRDHVRSYANPRDFLDSEAQKARLRKPDQGILDHDRKRAIEVRVFALRDELEDKDVDEAEIDRRCDELRKSLTAAAEQPNRAGGGALATGNAAPRRFKAHQVHEQAQAKAAESERLRRALHISKDYEEGGHWRRQDEKQELKRKKEEVEREHEREHERQRDVADRHRRRHHSQDPPMRSVEKPSHNSDDDDDDDGHHDNLADDKSDLEEGEYDDRDRGRQDGRRVRQRRGSPPGRDSRDSRSRSHSRRSSSKNSS